MFNKEFLKTITILYVEDDQDIRDSLGAILQRVFKEVIICIDGQDGLEKFKSINDDTTKNIDIIVSDIRMPNVSGLEMLASIRELDKEIPAVLTTAHGESNYLMDAIKVGVSHYAMKPINTQELLTNIQKICMVSHQKQLIERKEKKLSSYMKIIDNVATIVKLDCEHKFLEVNDLFCEVSGYSQEDLIGQEITFVTHPDILSTVHNAMITNIQNDKIWEGIYKNKDKDDNVFYLKVSAIPELNDMSQDIIGYMLIGFVATEDEQDKRETMGKVRKNIINQKKKENQLKDEIVNLQKELLEAKTKLSSNYSANNDISYIKDALVSERNKSTKLVRQVQHYEDEIKALEVRLANIFDIEKKKRQDLEQRLSDAQKSNKVLETNLIHTQNELNKLKPKR
jgi:PAS domain S-box-containing protein